MTNWFAIGIGSKNSKGDWLEVFYPKNLINPSEELTLKAKELVSYREGNFTSSIPSDLVQDIAKFSKNFSSLETERTVLVFVDSKLPPNDVPSCYLRLHLLSHRLAKPNEINLENIFTLMPTVAWTSDGPKDLKELNDILSDKKINNKAIHIHSLD